MKKFLQKINFELKPQLFVKLLFFCTIIGGLFIKAFYFQFTTKINTKPFRDILNIRMCIATIGTLFILFAVISLIFNKKRFISFIILHLFLSFILLADTIYFRYYYHPLSITVFYQIGVVDSIGGSTLSLFRLKDIVFVLDLPVILLSYLYIRKKGLTSLSFAARAILSLPVLILGILFFGYSYNKAYKPSFTIDNNYVCKYLGVAYYHYYDAKSFVHDTFLVNRKLTGEEKELINNFLSEKKNTGSNYKNIAKGKNLIILQVEALQQFVINRSINGQEITPNLNKLIKESTYFDNFYYQIGDGNTSDAEFLVNTSLYPIKHGSVNFRYPGNTYSSIASILDSQGYATAGYHANRPTFWNRSIMYNSLGFKVLHGNPSFNLDDKVGWGLSDASFFKQAMKLTDTNKPFYNLMITLSSHFPYNFDYSSRSKLDTGKYKNTLLGRYLNAQNYVDSCIGDFVNELKKKGLFDNSVLLIYGDHYGIPKDDAKDLLEFLNLKNNEFEWTKLQKVPFIVHYPGVENGTIKHTTGGELDIMPTVANLMGFEAPYAIGKDLFNTSNGYALLRNGSLATDKYIYIQSQSKAFNITDGALYSDDGYKLDLKKYLYEYEISQLIVEKNALKNSLK
jgi:lipoteichoic acid synthase